MSFRYPRPPSDRQPGIEESYRRGILRSKPFQDYARRVGLDQAGKQYIPTRLQPSPHRGENVGYKQLMQNQFPFYEDRIVDVARRNDPFVGAMLEQMYDQDPYRGYGQLGDNFKPNISVEVDDLTFMPSDAESKYYDWLQRSTDDMGVENSDAEQKYLQDIIDGLKDTYKIFYDHGAITPAIGDFFGLVPDDEYASDYLNEYINE